MLPSICSVLKTPSLAVGVCLVAQLLGGRSYARSDASNATAPPPAASTPNSLPAVRRTLRGRPTLIGTTDIGNSTEFRSGKIASCSGRRGFGAERMFPQ